MQLSNDEVAVSLNPTGGLTIRFKAHELSVPATAAGMNVLVRVLNSRAIAARNGEGSTIAQPGAPIAYMVEQWLRENKVTRTLYESDFDMEQLKEIDL